MYVEEQTGFFSLDKATSQEEAELCVKIDLISNHAGGGVVWFIHIFQLETK